MADENIKDVSVNLVLMGFLFFCLVTFVLTFVYNNNPDALGDYGSNFEDSASDVQTSLTEIETDVNENLNSSAELSSNEEGLGIQASASSSYSIFGSGKNFWTTIKPFIAWVFSGAIGQILIGVLGGILGLVGSYYIIRLIRGVF